LLFAKKQVTLLHELRASSSSSSSSSLPRSVGGASGFWYAHWVVLNVLSAAACGAQTYRRRRCLLFHVFFPELVLELLVLSLCKSALKTKEIHQIH
jgi:hypothetical protein